MPQEIRARLSTLLGLDDLPGELCGWGPLLPDDVRALVAEHHHASWRWVLTDDSGHLIAVGLTRRRPDSPARPPCAPRAEQQTTVEIAAPASLLRALEPTDHPRWAALVGDLRERALRPTDLVVTLDLPGAGATPARRFADAALDRAIRARDRRCRGPACRAPVLPLSSTTPATTAAEVPRSRATSARTASTITASRPSAAGR